MNEAKSLGIMSKLEAVPFWIYIAVGAAVGLLIGIFLIVRKLKNRKPVKTLPTLEKLLRRQIVCKTLTANRVTKWMDECIRKYPDTNLVFFIGHLKKKNLPMFTSSRVIAENVDPESYMFIEAVDNDTKFPVDVVIVNCSELDNTLSDLLGDDDYRLISNDQDNG